jgi:hypothetical protein
LRQLSKFYFQVFKRGTIPMLYSQFREELMLGVIFGTCFCCLQILLARLVRHLVIEIRSAWEDLIIHLNTVMVCRPPTMGEGLPDLKSRQILFSLVDFHSGTWLFRHLSANIVSCIPLESL